MKRQTLSFIILAVLFSINIFSQTAGTLTFSFTPVIQTPGYDGTKNHLAVWIQTSAGAFVKTKLRYAQIEVDHLPTYAVNSGGTAGNCTAAACNKTDAITGATLPNFSTKTIVWDGKNVNGAANGTTVTDGVYKITIEQAWNHGTTGNVVKSYTFTKGPIADNQTPTDDAYFSNIKLDWIPSLEITTTSLPVKCKGDNTGAATAITTNGTAPFTYLWSTIPAQSTATATGLTEGTYTVTVSDIFTTTTATVSVTVAPEMNASFVTQNISCKGYNDGLATVNITNGTPQYTYVWQNGLTTQTITGLSPGNYSLTITDSNGCTISADNNITEPDILALNLASTKDTCIGHVGIAMSNPIGGTAPYKYLWSNSSSTKNISSLAANNYSVTITDKNGCSSAGSVLVGTYTKTITATFTSSLANCHKPNGSITANPSGGTNPYSYVWSNGASAQTANNILAGNYTVNITDKNGCVGSSSSTVGTSASIAIPAICLVTVDSLSQHNMIVWDKTPFAGAAVKSFIVYRDTANNNFAPIGKTPFDSLSQFIDTVRTLYPANGDPNFSSWRYKLAMEDSCGNVSPKSLYHQSLFIQNNSANFNWTDYKIEGQPVPIPSLSNYLFQRDDFSTGNYVTIATLSASSNLSTDPQYSTFQNTANWRVQTQWSISCTPTRAIKTTKSNTIKKTAGGIRENELDRMVNIYPNPSSGRFTIEVNSGSGSMQLSIYDMFGKLIYKEAFAEKKKELNLILPKGIYQLQIETILGKANKKIIIQ